MSKARSAAIALSIGALGVVFGDIGTSPLYALRAIFSPSGRNLAINQLNIHGIVSLIIWSVTLVVSIKYIAFIMRADNKGEGGIMALLALAKNAELSKRAKWACIFVGLIGVALFYGDSAITPAISVLSAVEGLKVVTPSLSVFVIPATLVIIAYLFWIQRYGTAWLGRLFGPIMLVWFSVLAAGGLWQIMQHPEILHALSPLAALRFIAAEPLTAFLSLGIVVLAITGAEALYADMGHFGRPPIARAWFLVVFPALTLCYMGQGAFLLNSPTFASNVFMLSYPEAVRVPVLLLATFATLIASQSVISGAFSLTRQAIHLNFLPKMLIRHTSDHEIGQIYIPFISALLFITVTGLVLFFGSSEQLASAYGLAVSGTLAVDTILFLVIMRLVRRRSLWYIIFGLVVFSSIDMLFIGANAPKIVKGGWFPLAVAFLIFTLIQTWLKGQRIASGTRKVMEGSLKTFVSKIHNGEFQVTRIPGQAIYIGHHPNLAPLALHASVEEMHELHEKAVIVSVTTTNHAHVPEEERATFDDLGFNDGISHLNLSYGFHDSINVPKALKAARHLNPELDFDPHKASYFVSLSRVVPTHKKNLSRWRKSIYALMYRNASSSSEYYKLPIDRTIEIRSLIKL
jgi:KUP system potassium uptake protein